MDLLYQTTIPMRKNQQDHRIRGLHNFKCECCGELGHTFPYMERLMNLVVLFPEITDWTWVPVMGWQPTFLNN